MTEMNPAILSDVSFVTSVHRVGLEPVGIGASGQRYRVHFAGRVLIESSRDPEFDTCRALKAMGLTGVVETYSFPAGKVWRMRVEIERGAGWCTEEGARNGLRHARFKSYQELD